MKIFGYCVWHRWKPIYIKSEENFIGEKIYVDVGSNYRICKDCLIIQEFSYDSWGGVWRNLSNDKSIILIKKTYKENNKIYLESKPNKFPKTK